MKVVRIPYDVLKKIEPFVQEIQDLKINHANAYYSKLKILFLHEDIYCELKKHYPDINSHTEIRLDAGLLLFPNFLERLFLR